MHYQNRIAINPDIMLGKPIIKGTRITVELILKKLSDGISINELVQDYSSLSREDVLSALSYTADVISKEEFIAS